MENRKKITFFIYNMYSSGGTERVVSLIANEMSKKYDVEIVSLYKTEEKSFYKLNKNINVINILSKELTPYKKYIPYLYLKIRRFFKNYKTDVFISAGMRYIFLTSFMNKRAKYIAWEHYNSFSAKKGSVTWFGRKIAAKKAKHIVVLTERDKNNNIELFKTQSKIRHIYNPMELRDKDIVYKKESKKIVSVGHLKYVKGFDMLIDVAAKVFEKHPDWEWHIYGDGPNKGLLEQKVRDNKLENNIKFMGRTDKMNELYNDYAMFVLTSRSEGLGMVNLEAHSSKLPIISFNCNCGPDEIIQDGVNGYIVECFDIDKMAEKINYLIENEELRYEMSQNTLLDKEKFMMESIIKKWEEII